MKYAAWRKGVIMIIAAAAVTALLAAVISAGKMDNTPVFDSHTDARAYYCQQILDHKRQIQFTYVTDNGNTSQVCKFFHDDAFADEGSDFSSMGDYLRYSLFDGYKASCSYLKKNKKHYYTFSYRIAYKTSAVQEKKFEILLQETLDSLHLEKKTAYDKVKTIYDYICHTVQYDDIHGPNYSEKYTAYAALVNQRAVCQGYSTLFYRMCKAAKIPVRIVAGTGRDENHAWNIVKLGHVYYNVDATWDAGRKEYAYFLKSDDAFTDHQRSKEYASPSFNAENPMAAFNY
ncbi:transglutaminase domain-containing protein [Emergencia sp.]|uniref:transglutaminase domain-containing protein n=1 Tax=Emergencia sp. TaxID=1926557 RepID=UPI003AF02CDA